jgi:hypothetical protein
MFKCGVGEAGLGGIQTAPKRKGLNMQDLFSYAHLTSKSVSSNPVVDL